MILQVISAFFATGAFSILFHLPRKYIVTAGINGAVGWLIYLAVYTWIGDKACANLCATLMVSVIAHIMARRCKAPVTMFLIPGVIPLVPGAGMYLIVHSIFCNDTGNASGYFFETFKMAGAIALGICIVDTMFLRRCLYNNKIE